MQFYGKTDCGERNEMVKKEFVTLPLGLYMCYTKCQEAKRKSETYW